MKKVKREKNKLVITLEIEEASESASGKSFLVASTHGVIETDIMLNGGPIQVVANAFVYKLRKDSDE